MDEKEILNQLGQILSKLEKVGESIKNNDWEGVEKSLARAVKIQEKIKKNPVSIDDYMAQNPAFKKEYSSIKSKLLDRLQKNTAAVEAWKATHVEKIAGSKDALDNISKYFKPKKTSFYIDKKE
jgi:hypothetical protein